MLKCGIEGSPTIISNEGYILKSVVKARAQNLCNPDEQRASTPTLGAFGVFVCAHLLCDHGIAFIPPSLAEVQ